MKPFARVSKVMASLSIGIALAGGRAFADDEKQSRPVAPATVRSPDATAVREEAADPPKIQGLEMLPAGKTNLGVRLPVFEGARQTMLLKAKELTPIDKDELAMTDVEIRILNEEGSEDTKIVMLSSRYLVTLGLLSSEEETTVHGVDYTITGDTMDFDAKKKYGIMRGHVKMVIRNFNKLKGDTEGGEVLKVNDGSAGAAPEAPGKPATEKNHETIPQAQDKP